MRPITLRPAAELAADKPHGLRIKYLGGCRCLQCRAANSRYAADRAVLRRAGKANDLVPAEASRQHLLQLSRQSVGLSAVADAADLSRSLLSEIRNGRRPRIRRETQRRILRIDQDAVSDGAHISAATSKRQLAVLRSEGFTIKELSRRTGLSTPVLEMKRHQVTAKTAARLDRFYRIIMKGA